MPFVPNLSEEEKERQVRSAPGTTSPVAGDTSVRLSPQAAIPPVGGGGSAVGATTTNPAISTTGGHFGSLQDYLTANQGQAAPLASKLTPGIEKEYGGLQDQSNQTIASLNKQVSNAPGYTASNPDVMEQEATNPVSFSGDPGKVKQFQSLLNNSYGGPTSAEGTPEYANQQNTINQAIAKGHAQTTTEAGRSGLIEQNEGVKTAGNKALNSAILSQDPTALSSIEKAYDPFKNLLGGLQGGAQDVNANIRKTQEDAKNSSKAAQDAIAGQSSAVNTAIGQRLTAAQQAASTKNAAIQKELQGLYGGVAADTTPTTLGTYGGGSTPWANTTNYNVNALSPETSAALGMNPDQAGKLQQAMKDAATSQYMTGHNFGAGSGTSQIDLSQFLKQQDPTKAFTAANIATPDEYAREQAFQTLLGQLPTGAALNPNQASMAGTAPTNTNTFDYNAALANAQQTAAAERQAAQDQANALTGGADLAHAQSQHGGGMFSNLDNFVKGITPWVANAPLALGKKTLEGAKKVSQKA